MALAKNRLVESLILTERYELMFHVVFQSSSIRGLSFLRQISEGRTLLATEDGNMRFALLLSVIRKSDLLYMLSHSKSSINH